LDPSLSVAPLVQDDNLRRGGLCAAQLWRVATLCRPDTRNEKNRLKLTAIEVLKNGKNGFDCPVDRSVELGLGFCFQ
jgi:hypothetical protein